jgi:hypothetical protein
LNQSFEGPVIEQLPFDCAMVRKTVRPGASDVNVQEIALIGFSDEGVFATKNALVGEGQW